MKHDWFYVGEITHPGWYAILYCWESYEGAFISSSYFNGENFQVSYPIIQVAGPFNTEKEADKWANENDISW